VALLLINKLHLLVTHSQFTAIMNYYNSYKDSGHTMRHEVIKSINISQPVRFEIFKVT